MKLFVAIFLIFLTSISIFAQNTQNDEWVRVQSDNGEISFAIPKDYFYFFDKKGFAQSNPNNWSDKIDYVNLRGISAFEKGVTLFFESYDSNANKKGLAYLLSNYKDGKYAKIDFEKFSGLYIVDEKDAFKTYYYFASEKHTYLIGFACREKTNPTINRFLASIKLNGKNAFTATAKFPEPTEVISLSNLKETQVEIEKIEKVNDKKKNEQKKVSNSNPINIIPENLNPIPANNDSIKELSSPLVVFFKPRAQYTNSARQSGEQGNVQFKVNFLANGHIGKITVVKTLEDGLVENAIRAIKRIRFIPAERANLPSTVTKSIIYNFTLY